MKEINPTFNDCWGGVGMSKTITYDSQGRDITCMKEYSTLKYPCQECDREDCEERKDYEKTKSRK